MTQAGGREKATGSGSRDLCRESCDEVSGEPRSGKTPGKTRSNLSPTLKLTQTNITESLLSISGAFPVDGEPRSEIVVQSATSYNLPGIYLACIQLARFAAVLP